MMTDFKDILNSEKKYIMGIAMISIMLFHEDFLDGVFFQEMRRFGHLGVDLFLMLSGYGIAHSLSKNSTLIYFKNRVIRLFPSCIFWGTIGILVALFVDGQTPPLRYYLLNPLCLNKWFIYAIWLFYCISPFLFRLAKENLVLFIAISFCIPLILFKVDLTQWWPLDWTIGRFAAYAFGFGLFFTAQFHLNWWTIASSTLFLLSEILIQCSGNQGFMYLFFIPEMPVVCLLIHCFRVLTNKIRCSSLIEYIGIYSLEIYLVHEMIFAQMKKIVLPGEVLFVLAVAFSFLFAPLPILIMNRLRKIRNLY